MKIAVCLSGNDDKKLDLFSDALRTVLSELRDHEVVVFLVDGNNGELSKAIAPLVLPDEMIMMENYDKYAASSKLSFLVQRHERRNKMKFDIGVKCELSPMEIRDGWFKPLRRGDEVYVVEDKTGDPPIKWGHIHMRKMSFDFFYSNATSFVHLMAMNDFGYERMMAESAEHTNDLIPGTEYYFSHHIKRIGYYCIVGDEVTVLGQ